MTVVSLAVTIYRKPLACLRRPRMRYWRNRPDVQRLYERSLLLGGIGLGAFSVIVLFLHLIVIPRLERTFTDQGPLLSIFSDRRRERIGAKGGFGIRCTGY